MDYPIRVLCVFSTLDRGGAETMCMNLYRKIDRTNVQFDFVKHTSPKGAYEDEITSLGGYIYRAPEYRVNKHFIYCRWWERHFRNHPEHIIIHGHYFTISAVFSVYAKTRQDFISFSCPIYNLLIRSVKVCVFLAESAL